MNEQQVKERFIDALSKKAEKEEWFVVRRESGKQVYENIVERGLTEEEANELREMYNEDHSQHPTERGKPDILYYSISKESWNQVSRYKKQS